MREIVGNLYRITVYGVCRNLIVECDNEEDLIRKVIELEKRGSIVTNVVLFDITSTSVRTPKVAVKSSALYKKFLKEIK